MKKLIAVLLIGTGLTGAILFLPQNIQSQHTCYFNQFWSPNHTASGSYAMAGGHRHAQMHSVGEQELLANYLVPYGFFWWASLLVLGIGLWRVFRKQKQASPQNKVEFVNILAGRKNEN